MRRLLVCLFVMFCLTGCGEDKYKNGEVNVLNWSSYIPDSVINDFENEKTNNIVKMISHKNETDGFFIALFERTE